MIFLNPWALRMGGRWTPALTWHGARKLQSTSGASYGLFMEVTLSSRHGRGHNLQGTAKLCTRQEEIFPSPLTATSSARGSMPMENLLHFIFVR
jgi:hypothetical protein